MRYAGLDIGSRTIKLVVREQGEITLDRVVDAIVSPLDVCRNLLDGLAYDRLVVSGYGRHLFSSYWDCDVITEIKAVALGVRCQRSTTRTIVDIGGQDTKTIALDDSGAVRKFAMNDRCAAGTGRFLEVMATALSFSREDFILAALSAERAATVNAMCTVFAESEVISQVARGFPPAEIALGIHRAIAGRTVALMKTMPIEDDIVFVGGGALNPCLHRLIGEQFNSAVWIPARPQSVTALGCALYAESLSSRLKEPGRDQIQRHRTQQALEKDQEQLRRHPEENTFANQRPADNTD